MGGHRGRYRGGIKQQKQREMERKQGRRGGGRMPNTYRRLFEEKEELRRMNKQEGLVTNLNIQRGWWKQFFTELVPNCH